VLDDANYIVGVGADSLLSIVTLREDFAGAAGGDSGSFVTAGKRNPPYKKLGRDDLPSRSQRSD
jgi:hypothetical protein